MEEVNYYVAGIIAGEGGFSVGIEKSKSHRLGKQVKIRFSITNTSREVVELVKKTLRCGGDVHEVDMNKHVKDGGKRKKVWEFQVQSYRDMIERVIPFIEKYSIIPLEKINQNYVLVKRVAELMKRREHLTEEGIKKIEDLIKEGASPEESWGNLGKISLENFLNKKHS